MKAELMALALLFAFVGFINSQLGPAVGDRAAQFMAAVADGVLQPWIDPHWLPSPAIQALLLGLQVAIGCIMVAYFLRHRREKRPIPEWD
jgi:ABC-type cobalt transport system substrate-binding protein